MRRSPPEPTAPCPCDSGLRFADCHGAGALPAQAPPEFEVSLEGCTFQGLSGVPILIGGRHPGNPHNRIRALNTEAENPVVFKHLKAKYANAMLNDGCVRLAMMSSFKDDPEPIGDAHEGYEHSASDAQAIFRTGNVQVNVSNVRSTTHVDGLVYCVSLNNKKVSDDYDACVHIEDCDAFFEELRRASERRGPRFLGWARVEYTERDVPIETVLSESIWWRTPGSGKFFRKPVRFRSQHEIRGAWDECHDFDGKDLVINVPGITRLLRRVF